MKGIMDLFIIDFFKQTLNKILNFIIFCVLLLPLSVMVIIFNIIFKPHKLLNYFYDSFKEMIYQCKLYIYVKILKKRAFFFNGFVSVYKKNHINTEKEIKYYSSKYVLTLKHYEYLYKISKKTEEFDIKILYQIVYFSKIFGSLFYYIFSIFSDRLKIKYNLFQKKKKYTNIIGENLDILDLFFLLIEKENIYSIINLDKLLNSILLYANYKDIELGTFIENFTYKIFVSKLNDEQKINLILILFNHCKNIKRKILYGYEIESLKDYNYKEDFFEKLFYVLDLKSDNKLIVYKILEIFDYISTDKEKDLLNYFNKKELNSKELKIIISLLILSDYPLRFKLIEEKIKNLNFNKEESNEIMNFILFFKLRNSC